MGMGQINDVRGAVEDELTFDPDVDASDITVENTDGTVPLNGTVPSYPQYVAAAAGAQRVVGVKNVRNHLEVALPPRDYRDDLVLAATADNALALTTPCRAASRRQQRTATSPSPAPCATPPSEQRRN